MRRKRKIGNQQKQTFPSVVMERLVGVYKQKDDWGDVSQLLTAEVVSAVEEKDKLANAIREAYSKQGKGSSSTDTNVLKTEIKQTTAILASFLEENGLPANLFSMLNFNTKGNTLTSIVSERCQFDKQEGGSQPVSISGAYLSENGISPDLYKNLADYDAKIEWGPQSREAKNLLPPSSSGSTSVCRLFTTKDGAADASKEVDSMESLSSPNLSPK